MSTPKAKGVTDAISVTRPESELSQSSLWTEILDSVRSQALAGRLVTGTRQASLEAMRNALARTHSRILLALAGNTTGGEDTVSELAWTAVELVVSAARLSKALGAPGGDRRGWLADQLRRRLAGHEDAVLAGEVTYSVWPEQAEKPAAAVRQAITRLSRDADVMFGDVLSLSTAAVELAALLLRMAANARVSGRGGDAAEERPAALDQQLHVVTAELAALASSVQRPADGRGDVVAHHLAAGLRVRFSHGVGGRPSDGSSGPAVDPAALAGLREAWLLVATNEYVAVSALDRQLAAPAYDQSFGGLSEAVVEAAANVICGARLLGRPEAFAHTRAWDHQATALTYALEAYVAGLRGHASSLAQTQLITLTRLVRATVAVVLIDLRADALPANSTAVR